MQIVKATQNKMPLVRKLFQEYQEWLGIDLGFQNFEKELANLPGAYAPPFGVIFLAIKDNHPVGCVGVRQWDRKEAELKRLYVRQDNRGCGVGGQLFQKAMNATREMGYTSIVLDTLSTMTAARALYVANGFKEVEAYYHNPVADVVYYRRLIENSF